MPPVPFGPRLKALRERAGFSVVELSSRSGIARTYIHDLESGRREPSWELVQRLAEALEVSTEDFRIPGDD